MIDAISPSAGPIGVLFSGGLDSTVLVGWLLEHGHRVQPIYVRGGMVWESAELAAAEQVIPRLQARYDDLLSDLVVLDMPVADLFPRHWSITGRGVPDGESSDDAVYLPGRNPLLLLKACLWCQQRGVRQIAMGTLSRNPFRDATRQFFETFRQMLLAATGMEIKILRPFQNATKQQLLALSKRLPLEQTFSCLAPIDGKPCHKCNKCAERSRALSAR